MRNIISNKPLFTVITAGYTQIYAAHNPPQDYDYAGKSLWVDGVRTDLHGSDTLYVVKKGLEEGTTYQLEMAFYDAMVTTRALDNRFGVLVSDKVAVKTKEAPWIKSIEVQKFSVDIGISAPDLLFHLGGNADFVEIEYRTGTGPWEGIFRGGFSDTIQFQSPIEGVLEFRIRGAVPLGDGGTPDYSPYKAYPHKIQVDKGLNPPAPATNVRFSAAKVSDTFEHIDVLVNWDWEKGEGGLVKSFVLEYLPTEEYERTGWAKSKRLPTATAQEAVIANFPYMVLHTFRVRSVAWGPEDINTTFSEGFVYGVYENTEFDSSVVLRTKMEMNYSGLRAYRQEGDDYKQTFGLDASTGSVNIGEVGPDGTSPITVDPLTGTLTVDGKVITESIYSASFILTDFGGNNPAIYSQGKSYGSVNSGIWMGVENGKYKLDIGNTSQYLRWTGDSLLISGAVRIGVPGGDVSLEDGLSKNREAFIYRADTVLPSTPTGTDYPPAGWSSVVVPTSGSQALYVCSGTLNIEGTSLREGASWSSASRFSGPQGQDGKDGGQGASLYTWIRYADTPTGSGISDSPIDKAYIGISYNKTNPTESTDPKDYTWSKIEGDKGTPGPPGSDGQSLYTWIKYADSINGDGLSNSAEGKSFIGMAFNKTKEEESDNPNDYTWSQIRGADGKDGDSILWKGNLTTAPKNPKDNWAYRNLVDGVTYIYVDGTWVVMVIDGPRGEAAAEKYIWIRYADTPSTGMSNSPKGKSYIGVAYNKDTSTESGRYEDYEWSYLDSEDSSILQTITSKAQNVLALAGKLQDQLNKDATEKKPDTFYQTIAPRFPKKGDIWVRATDKQIYMWDGNDWVDGKSGQSTFKSTVFKRSTDRPTTPTGGSYTDAVPSGWSDGIPAGTEKLWATTRVFSADGELPQQAEWTTPESMTNTASLEFQYSSIAIGPGNPSTSPSNWTPQPSEETIWLAQRKIEDGVPRPWEVFKIKGEKGEKGQESFKSTVFVRSIARPDNPIGASYADPVPSGWSDGVPSGDLQLWASTRIFSSDGLAPQQANWTTPQAMTSTATLELRYSSKASSPGTPTSDSANWSSEASIDTIWLAQRRIVNGVEEPWEVVKIKGEKGEKGADGEKGTDGAQGQNGPGFYAQTISLESNNVILRPELSWDFSESKTPLREKSPGFSVVATDNNNNPRITSNLSTGTGERYFFIGKEPLGRPYKLVPNKRWIVSFRRWSGNPATGHVEFRAGWSNRPYAEDVVFSSPVFFSETLGRYYGILDMSGSSANEVSLGFVYPSTSTGWMDHYDIQIEEDSGSGLPTPFSKPGASPISFSPSQATSFFQTNFGRGPVKFDTITQYISAAPEFAETRMWDGSSWTVPALVVHGDAIVDGTVRAQALVADNAFLAQIGVDTIYNNAAALSGNPEANYTMKISLDQGFIHIR